MNAGRTRSAAIISIGDELLIGQVINTNAATMAQKLNSVGILVRETATVGDDEAQILEAFGNAFGQYPLTLVTGGLGPTHDDVTRGALLTFLHTTLVLHGPTLEHIKNIMQRRNIPWTPAAEDQAMVPQSCTVIPNSHGTAPGMMFEREGAYLIVMPGVPYEMESMMDDFVLPFLREKMPGRVVHHRTLKTTGIPESFLAAKLGNIHELVGRTKLAFLPTPGGVRLRITAVGNDAATVDEEIRVVEQRIRQKTDKYIYGADEEELEHVVGRLLTERKLTIAVAESCTGGSIANRITNVPGSSNYFERGVVTYSDRSKTDTLRVPENLLDRFGAVSKEVAEAMAAGMRADAKTDIAVSTTGIAGPTGGSPDKPVGLVWIGYSDKESTFALKFNFGDQRLRFKERASQAALELVRRRLLSIEPQQQGKY